MVLRLYYSKGIASSLKLAGTQTNTKVLTNVTARPSDLGVGVGGRMELCFIF